MKKIITITTLLAAGTLFASADQNLTINSATSGNWDQLNGNGNSVANITVTENATITRIDGSSINGLTTINLMVNDGVAFNVTNYAKLPYNCTSNTYTTTIDLGKNSSISVTNALSLGSRNASFKDITMNSVLNFAEGSSISAGTLQTVAADASANNTSSITIGLDFTDSMLVDTAGDTYVDTYVRTLITANTYTGITADTFALNNILDLDNRNYTNGGIVSSIENLAAGQYGLVFSGSNVQFVAVAPVPEPSAFGLLAGLGALALAGTRRRRRKA
ncbi:MAG: PEP-CTERM sorting domain-containing protein [Candidatus Spyradosoma sp.]